MKSVMQFAFDMLPKININRSQFDCSHGHKTTLDAGYLVPIDVLEIYPGDTVNCRLSMFARLQTMIKPVMDNIWIDTFHFYVPSRILWTHFRNMLGEKRSTTDVTSYILPTVSWLSAAESYTHSLWDYFGIPLAKTQSGDPIVSLPFRAYNKIWNEYFRDQNLQDPVPEHNEEATTDGPDDPLDFVLLRRCKRHDYFNGCLPWPQKGNSVDVPLGTTAPVYGNGVALGITTNRTDTSGNNYGLATGLSGSGVLGGKSGAWNSLVGSSQVGADNMGSYQAVGVVQKSQVGGVPARSGIYADLSSATAATINQLRQAFQAQKMLERDARCGTRMKEIILGHFGVDNGDSRLQRPEYLGGSSDKINVNVVQQTSSTGITGSTTKQADLAAYACAPGRAGYVGSFTEHGYIISLVNIRADLTYQYGLGRMWSRSTRDDLYWPEYAHLGEQAVYNREIYADGSADDDLVWGYNERFAELRHQPSRISGQFRSSYAQPLDIWHLAQKMIDTPILSDAYIQDNPPIDRVIAYPGTTENPLPQIFLDCYFKQIWARALPTYGTPGLIDHF